MAATAAAIGIAAPALSAVGVDAVGVDAAHAPRPLAVYPESHTQAEREVEPAGELELAGHA